jgi:hypothetical protein
VKVPSPTPAAAEDVAETRMKTKVFRRYGPAERKTTTTMRPAVLAGGRLLLCSQAAALTPQA